MSSRVPVTCPHPRCQRRTFIDLSDGQVPVANEEWVPNHDAEMEFWCPAHAPAGAKARWHAQLHELLREDEDQDDDENAETFLVFGAEAAGLDLEDE